MKYIGVCLMFIMLAGCSQPIKEVGRHEFRGGSITYMGVEDDSGNVRVLDRIVCPEGSNCEVTEVNPRR